MTAACPLEQFYRSLNPADSESAQSLALELAEEAAIADVECFAADRAPGPGADGTRSDWIYDVTTTPKPHSPADDVREAQAIAMRGARYLILRGRVERLQDITEDDAWSEGCERGDPWDNGQGFFQKEVKLSDVCTEDWDSARDWYADLWESINGPDSWDANPWVWCVQFRRVSE